MFLTNNYSVVFTNLKEDYIKYQSLLYIIENFNQTISVPFLSYFKNVERLSYLVHHLRRQNNINMKSKNTLHQITRA